MASNKTEDEHLKFPYDIVPIDPEINSELLDFFHGERDGFVQVGPSKYFFAQNFKNSAEGYYNFEARQSDVWVATFPRSGTTWTQEMVWLISNNLNFKKARDQPLTKRFPFFEFNHCMHPEVKSELLSENANYPEKQEFIEVISQPGYEFLKNVTEQRFIKTHLPFSLMPTSVMEKKCKVIYVARNPKDVAVSFYYLNRLYKTQGYVGDFERYWTYFEKGLNTWMPYWSHIKEGWDNRHHPNVLFLFYEDMVKDLRKVLTKLSNFLGKELTSEDYENLMNHLNVANFKQNTAINGKEMNDIGLTIKGEAAFVRKGTVIDGWQAEYSDKLKARAEKWIRENMEKTGIVFPE
ncbi:luciferin sulfotransferase [Eupeodes corollae]|uniref:luciferin sulfotransferase n=1 Tax=Eupeodes corollae TaxID=290404 RepID=UPI0024923285|nr:luciferin sulfotransferase [Eupeodes corollae]